MGNRRVLEKGAGPKEQDPCGPTLGSVTQSVRGAGAVLLTSLAKGAGRVEWRLLLCLNLFAVSLFKASKREVKGLWGEDLQGMETLC